MLNEFLELLSKAESVLVGKARATVFCAPLTGEPENQVVRLAWGENPEHSVKLTEEGVENGRFDPKTKTFKVFDDEGESCSVQLLRDGQALCPPDGFEQHRGRAYVVIQEGGSSSELYAQALCTRPAAEAYQASSWNKGAYRTSDIVEVPASLANHPEFLAVAEALVQATLTLAARGAKE